MQAERFEKLFAVNEILKRPEFDALQAFGGPGLRRDDGVSCWDFV